MCMNLTCIYVFVWFFFYLLTVMSALDGGRITLTGSRGRILNHLTEERDKGFAQDQSFSSYIIKLCCKMKRQKRPLIERVI